MKIALKLFCLHLGVAFFLMFSCPSVGGQAPYQILEALGFTVLKGTPIDFELPDLSGGKTSLSAFRGKWVLLVFWATWCGPCVEEMPALEALYREHKARGFSVVGASVDTDQALPKNFQFENQISFPLLHDPSGSVSSKYQASALPTLYVISPDWKLAGILQGAKDWNSQVVRQNLQALLKH
jgi:peroxiredoxin